MIKLQFSTTNSVASRLVRVFTWSNYSHVDFLLDDGRLLGADFDGVSYRTNDPDKYTHSVVYEIPDASSDIITIARQEIGKKYDYAGIFGLLHRRDWQDRNKWFCSELVTYCLNRGGYPLLNNSQAYWRITPRDLLKSPYLVKVI